MNNMVTFIFYFGLLLQLVQSKICEFLRGEVDNQSLLDIAVNETEVEGVPLFTSKNKSKCRGNLSSPLLYYS